MKRLTRRLPPSAALLLASLLLVQSLLRPADGTAQELTTLGVDADPTGNTATSLGSIEHCTSVKTGDTFEVDIFITNATDLLAWEAYFVYDPSILRVEARYARLFQMANAGSNVFDASEAPPGEPGRYRIAAADIADPPAPDSGSGVLARLTLLALSTGVSLASLPPIDVTGDGRPDFGPTLADAAGKRIADANEDGLFDGPVIDAWIAVDTACPQLPPPAPTFAPFTPTTSTPPPPLTPSPSPLATLTTTPSATGIGGEGNDDPPWRVIGSLGGSATLLAASALVLWRLRVRRRRRDARPDGP
jgi:hypothetical protein